MVGGCGLGGGPGSLVGRGMVGWAGSAAVGGRGRARGAELRVAAQVFRRDTAIHSFFHSFRGQE